MMIFQTKGRRHTRDITPVGKTTLNNADHNYHRFPLAAYHMNIFINNMFINNLFIEWHDFKDDIRQKA